MKTKAPIATFLSYSAGVQSHWLLEMVLRGELEKPEHFYVINADPGMENSHSYEFVARTRTRCAEAGILFQTAGGPNLFKDLVEFGSTSKTRLDLPPYWTVNRETGKKGRLLQKCTYFYKLAPMRRVVRQILHERYGVSPKSKRVPMVETWLGFASDEAGRVKPSDVKYVSLRFPLIELGLDRLKIEGRYLATGTLKPPRSVCNACFANGLSTLEEMYLNRPEDWDQAVAVDESIRDMTQLGVRDEVYVSHTCTPLKNLPALNFKRGDNDYKDFRCNTGVCFL